jgi:hypothetical protein
MVSATGAAELEKIMATIYVTETARFLNEPFRGMPKQLSAVRATVSDQPHGPMAKTKDFKPQQWRELLAQDGVMYRYKNDPYASVTA